MMLLFRLPDQVVVDVLSKWCETKDLNNFDSAVCNMENRSKFLNLVSYKSFVVHGSEITCYQMKWFVCRKLKVDALYLHDSKMFGFVFKHYSFFNTSKTNKLVVHLDREQTFAQKMECIDGFKKLVWWCSVVNSFEFVIGHKGEEREAEWFDPYDEENLVFNADIFVKILSKTLYLTSLKLSFCLEVHENDTWNYLVSEIADHCPLLKCCDLTGTADLAHSSFKRLFEKCVMLESTKLHFHTGDHDDVMINYVELDFSSAPECNNKLSISPGEKDNPNNRRNYISRYLETVFSLLSNFHYIEMSWLENKYTTDETVSLIVKNSPNLSIFVLNYCLMNNSILIFKPILLHCKHLERVEITSDDDVSWSDKIVLKLFQTPNTIKILHIYLLKANSSVNRTQYVIDLLKANPQLEELCTDDIGVDFECVQKYIENEQSDVVYYLYK
jgi:hypothetical protein